MSFNFNGASGGLLYLTVLVSVLASLFWMYVAWRAMRTHERLADAVREIAGANRRPLPRVSDGPIGPG